MRVFRVLIVVAALLAVAMMVHALPTRFAWHSETGLDISRDSAGAQRSSSIELRLPNNDTVQLDFSLGGSWKDGPSVSPPAETPGSGAL